MVESRKIDNGGMGQVAYLFGNDRQRGVIPPGTQGVASYGSTDIWKLRSGDPSDFLRIHIPGNFDRLATKPSLSGAKLVANLVTDPDLNPVVLGHARRFLKDFAGRVINRPEAVLEATRDRYALLLAGIDGLLVPRVARFRGRPNLAVKAIDEFELVFPAILRLAGSHGGMIVGVMRDRDQMLSAIAPDKTYFLTEFVQSRAREEPYHKIRVFYFGDTPIVRHRIISDHWNIHSPDRDRFLAHSPADIAIERALMEGGFALLPRGVRRVLGEIRERVPLDFFGIDFAIMPDQRVLLFEANATMSFYTIAEEPPFGYFGPMVERASRAVDAMLAG